MIRLAVTIALTSVTSACSQEMVSASFDAPTDRYRHGILGDAIEWGALSIKSVHGESRFVLPLDRVFEDLAPRLVDLDGDGAYEVIVVETSVTLGAQLAVYDHTGKIAETPHIGRTNRWLAPIGAADLDGDGVIEVAYVDRPHLAKTLRVWRFEDGELVHAADLGGVTNHRIGEDHISGGIRDCGTGPEMITASADWSQIMATTLADGVLSSRVIGMNEGPSSFDDAMACR